MYRMSIVCADAVKAIHDLISFRHFAEFLFSSEHDIRVSSLLPEKVSHKNENYFRTVAKASESKKGFENCLHLIVMSRSVTTHRWANNLFFNKV